MAPHSLLLAHFPFDHLPPTTPPPTFPAHNTQQLDLALGPKPQRPLLPHPITFFFDTFLLVCLPFLMLSFELG